MKARAILFDLDGTLADTAPDLAQALAALRPAESPKWDMDAVRKATPAGTRALLRLALGITPASPNYDSERQAFLRHYERLIGAGTVLLPGMGEVLAELARRAIPWGVVTNKPEALARRVLAALGLADTAACLIGGDTTGHMKPHPAPLIEACARLGRKPGDCVYVGDDARDVEAARAAGLRAFAVAFGYASADEARAFGADAVLMSAREILTLA